MIYPRKVYLIFPYDECGNIAGVYVGSSSRVKERIEEHLRNSDNYENQRNFHELMIKNGFAYGVVDEIEDYLCGHLEYDWANYFLENTNIKVFNSLGLKNANWHRLDSPKDRLNRRAFKIVSSLI